MIIAQNKTGISVAFKTRELWKYGILRARTYRARGEVYVDFAIPFITWTGSHDVKVIEDVIQVLKEVGNYASRQKGEGGSWTASGHKPTIYNETKIRFPVFARHSDPHVQAERIDGFVKWSLDGHAFNDDLPGIRAYVAALTQLKSAVSESNL